MQVPTEIKRQGTEGLEITWKDGTVHNLTSKILRENCPSADSKAKRGDTSHDAPLSPKKSALNVIEATLDEELSLQEIWPVGNYAIGIRWADGHDTGIYTFNFLYELGSK